MEPHMTSKVSADESVQQVPNEIMLDASGDVPDITFSLPEQIFIGYYAHIKKNDMLRYVKEYIRTHCHAPHLARYQIRKHMTGYMYEIHDGGKAGGVLSTVINRLNAYESSIINTANRKLHVTYSPAGPTSFLLKEDDVREVSPGIEYKDKLSDAYKSGFGFLIFAGVIFTAGLAVLGVSTVATSAASKEAAVPDFNVIGKETPINGLREIERQSPAQGQHISRLEFSSGSWEVRLRSDQAYYDILAQERRQREAEAIEEQLAAAREMVFDVDIDAGAVVSEAVETLSDRVAEKLEPLKELRDKAISTAAGVPSQLPQVPGVDLGVLTGGSPTEMLQGAQGATQGQLPPGINIQPQPTAPQGQ